MWCCAGSFGGGGGGSGGGYGVAMVETQAYNRVRRFLSGYRVSYTVKGGVERESERESVCVCVVVRNVNVWHAHAHTCTSTPRPLRVASPSWLPQLMPDSSIMSVAHSILSVLVVASACAGSSGGCGGCGLLSCVSSGVCWYVASGDPK